MKFTYLSAGVFLVTRISLWILLATKTWMTMGLRCQGRTNGGCWLGNSTDGGCLKNILCFFPPVKGDESFQFGGKVFMTSSENEWCKEVWWSKRLGYFLNKVWMRYTSWCWILLLKRVPNHSWLVSWVDKQIKESRMNGVVGNSNESVGNAMTIQLVGYDFCWFSSSITHIHIEEISFGLGSAA